MSILPVHSMISAQNCVHAWLRLELLSKLCPHWFSSWNGSWTVLTNGTSGLDSGMVWRCHLFLLRTLPSGVSTKYDLGEDVWRGTVDGGPHVFSPSIFTRTFSPMRNSGKGWTLLCRSYESRYLYFALSSDRWTHAKSGHSGSKFLLNVGTVVRSRRPIINWLGLTAVAEIGVAR